jgi:hypothetical protein
MMVLDTMTWGCVMWRREGHPAGAELVAGCEAFITGRYAEYFEERDQPVPAWVWMNLLGHGTHDELVSARGDLGSARGWARLNAAWRQARSYLAGEVLDAVDAGRGPLPQLQRRVLLPLESQLAVDLAPGRNPKWLVTAVLAALEEDRRRRRRRNGADPRHKRPLSS